MSWRDLLIYFRYTLGHLVRGVFKLFYLRLLLGPWERLRILVFLWGLSSGPGRVLRITSTQPSPALPFYRPSLVFLDTAKRVNKTHIISWSCYPWSFSDRDQQEPKRFEDEFCASSPKQRKKAKKDIAYTNIYAICLRMHEIYKNKMAAVK